MSFTTVGGESGYVPHAEALMELAKDKYQFATATENEAAPASSAAPLPPRLSVEGRLTKLEATLGSLASSLEVLTQQRAEVKEKPTPPQASRVAFSLPGLDPGVVKSALAAGIQMDSLRQFSQLLATSPARRLKDPGGGVAMKASVLDESGDEAEAEAVQATSNENLAVASAPQDPVSAALVKLTAIVEDLQGQEAQARHEAGASLGRCGRRVWVSRRQRHLEPQKFDGSPGLAASSSRGPGGDLLDHREADAGGPPFADPGAWDAEARSLRQGGWRTEAG